MGSDDIFEDAASTQSRRETGDWVIFRKNGLNFASGFEAVGSPTPKDDIPD